MKFDELLLNPQTKLLLHGYLKQPAHAVLLTGLEGVGLGTVAIALAAELTPNTSSRFRLLPEGTTITIDSIRDLYRHTRAGQKEKEVIIIDNVEQMSQDAQNAFLKLLEEPTKGRHFILTTHSSNLLLPTIHSRVQTVALKPISPAASKKLLESYKVDIPRQAQMEFMASGLPAELSRLANDDIHFDVQAEHVTAARKLLESNEYDRLGIVSRYTDRTKAVVLITVLGRLLLFSMRRKPKLQLLNVLDAVELVSERLQANGHVRTQLMYLVTKLP